MPSDPKVLGKYDTYDILADKLLEQNGNTAVGPLAIASRRWATRTTR
ncbi:MAG: hypothetical protein R3F11_28820 [Verrucomicrobiales bacterium]